MLTSPAMVARLSAGQAYIGWPALEEEHVFGLPWSYVDVQVHKSPLDVTHTPHHIHTCIYVHTSYAQYMIHAGCLGESATLYIKLHSVAGRLPLSHREHHTCSTLETQQIVERSHTMWIQFEHIRKVETKIFFYKLYLQKPVLLLYVKILQLSQLT